MLLFLILFNLLYITLIYQIKMMNTKANLLHKNTDSSTSNNNGNLSNSKYQKFPSFKHDLRPLNSLKREASLQVDNKFDRPQQKIVFYKDVNQGKSQSSLRSCQTPRKVPMTPRKHIVPSPHSRKKITAPTSSIKEVIFQLHQLIDQFSNLLESMKFQIALTIQSVMKNVQKQIKIFLSQYSLNQRSDIVFSTATFGQNQSKEICHQIQQLRNLQNIVAKNKIVRAQSISEEFEIFERSNTAHHLEIQKQKINEKQKQKGGIFSNMIKMRQNIRKDATNAVPKKPIRKSIDQDSNSEANNLGTDKRKDLVRRTATPLGSGNRQMTKSIQKIQLRLNSLKNILDQ